MFNGKGTYLPQKGRCDARTSHWFLEPSLLLFVLFFVFDSACKNGCDGVDITSPGAEVTGMKENSAEETMVLPSLFNTSGIVVVVCVSSDDMVVVTFNIDGDVSVSLSAEVSSALTEESAIVSGVELNVCVDIDIDGVALSVEGAIIGNGAIGIVVVVVVFVVVVVCASVVHVVKHIHHKWREQEWFELRNHKCVGYVACCVRVGCVVNAVHIVCIVVCVMIRVPLSTVNAGNGTRDLERLQQLNHGFEPVVRRRNPKPCVPEILQKLKRELAACE
eukprot:m.217983 g.217983  ORF g.217983 m.217983 type:complete len:276 (-) comp33247_c3_seq3:1273-2100(-)